MSVAPSVLFVNTHPSRPYGRAYPLVRPFGPLSKVLQLAQMTKQKYLIQIFELSI
jgi:hypothetical protein